MEERGLDKGEQTTKEEIEAGTEVSVHRTPPAILACHYGYASRAKPLNPATITGLCEFVREANWVFTKCMASLSLAIGACQGLF